MQEEDEIIIFTKKERAVIEYFLKNNNSPAYPAKIERDLEKNISRNYANTVCKKLNKRGIMDYKMIRPPRQKNKTEWFFLKEDIDSFKTIAWNLLKDKKGKRILIRSEYATDLINLELIEYIRQDFGISFEEKEAERLLTLINISPTGLLFALFAQGTEPQIAKKLYDKQKKVLEKDEQSYLYLDEYYQQTSNASGLEAFQLNLLIGLLTDISEVNIRAEKKLKSIESKIETKIFFSNEETPYIYKTDRKFNFNQLPEDRKSKY